MKKNQKPYKVAITLGSENATLIVITYELIEKAGFYFIEIKLGPHTIKHPAISIPSNRQANEVEELFILGETTILIQADRDNEQNIIEKKMEEIFGNSSKSDIIEI